MNTYYWAAVAGFLIGLFCGIALTLWSARNLDKSP